MFSDKLPGLIRAVAAIGQQTPVNPSQMRALLEKRVSGRPLESEEVIALLNGLSAEANRTLVRTISAEFRRPHDREILLLTPLYFSSICENKCAYCDFNASGGRLALPEFLEELDELLAQGYRSLELVSSQDPDLYLKHEPFRLNGQEFDATSSLEYFRWARRRMDAAGGGLLISNIPPLDDDSFRGLRAAGLDMYLSWAECFDPEQYAFMHPTKSPKSHQGYRLDAFQRALDAGIPHLAGAFLKGLFDWRREEAILYLFDRWLRETCGRGFSIIGTPRLKGPFAASERVRAFAVDDDDYELNLALDRILFDGALWLQTRESADFNFGFIRRYGGGVLLTADCSTAPGGYRRPARNKPQFPVHRQNVQNAIRLFEDAGFQTRFAWDAGVLREFQRDE